MNAVFNLPVVFFDRKLTMGAIKNQEIKSQNRIPEF